MTFLLIRVIVFGHWSDRARQASIEPVSFRLGTRRKMKVEKIDNRELLTLIGAEAKGCEYDLLVIDKYGACDAWATGTGFPLVRFSLRYMLRFAACGRP